MDPVSQGVLGSIASQNTARKKHIVAATVLGLLGGMAPDLDILIQSESDPLLFLEYHRQFTHSLVFIPVGGFICALLMHVFVRRRGLVFRETLLYCTAGYATHALLDSCTSYGTQLFWPFSDMRIAWSNISIVDPLFTIPLLVMALAAMLRRNPALARLAVVWVFLYLGFGLVQKERAERAGYDLASDRGHEPLRLEVKPGIGSMLLWKVIYETTDRYYVDGIRVALDAKVYPGDDVLKLDVKRDFPWLDPESQQARDIERFRWFSDGFVALHPVYSNQVIDVRYSMLPNRIDPLWMIELDPDADSDQHVGYAHDHGTPENAISDIQEMLLGL